MVEVHLLVVYAVDDKHLAFDLVNSVYVWERVEARKEPIVGEHSQPGEERGVQNERANGVGGSQEG